MATRRVIKVFLASPGDLVEERRAAKSVVDEFNDTWADEFDYQVELVGWEATLPGFGRPQHIINQELDRCELMVGMIWKRWGTPSGAYTSGFEEEFERSLERRRREGRPEIHLLFKDIDSELMKDPGSELQKVTNFRQRITDQKILLYQTFGTLPDFEKKFRASINGYIKVILNSDRDQTSEERRPPSGVQQSTTTPQADVAQSSGPLSNEGLVFASSFLTGISRGDEHNPYDIARFRLLGTLISADGNDDTVLGVHDANLLFRHRTQISLGERERLGLVSTALHNFSHSNTPLWFWAASLNGFEHALLQFLSCREPNERRVGALRAMRLIGAPLPSDSADRAVHLGSWFGEEADQATKLAGLQYLGDFGVPDDSALLRELIREGDNQISREATEALLRIALRGSAEAAVRLLHELQPPSVTKELIAEIFSHEQKLSDHQLLIGLKHQSVDVRRACLVLLRRRKTMPEDLSAQLLVDDDATIRFEALMCLCELGRSFSTDTAKGILVKQQSQYLPWLASSSGDEQWAAFRSLQLRALSDARLGELASEASLEAQDAARALDERHFSKRKDGLRRAIDNRFTDVFRTLQASFASQYASDSLLASLGRVEEHLRRSYLQSAVDVLCRAKDPSDLVRVRSAVRELTVSTEDCFEYFRAVGEWDDIHIVIELSQRSLTVSHASSEAHDEKWRYQLAARALTSLGRTRLVDLLGIAMPPEVLSRVLALATESGFRDLTDASLLRIYSHKDSLVRQVASLRAVASLPKKRVAALLSSYCRAPDTQYYNVFYWLDFGVSAPHKAAVRAARARLRQL